ncbi:MAG: hypothetical protein AB7K52_09595 [Phycisphaerales bacterium]
MKTLHSLSRESTTRRARTGRTCAARAFTLIELAMALLVTSVLVGAVGSLVVMTARAAGGNPKAQPTGSGAGDALSRLSAELSCALTITNASATGVSFTLADRDKDGQPEQIDYTWAGSGSPLRRTENGKAAVSITGPMSNFALRYATTSRTTSAQVDTPTTSSEVLLSSFTGWTGITPTSRELGVSTGMFGAQYFKIDALTLPAATSRIDITRVRLMMRRATAGSVTVSIMTPGTAPLASTTQVGSSASKSQVALEVGQRWEDFGFSDVRFGAEPTAGLCIVIKGTASTAAYLRYLDSISAPSDTPTFTYSTNAGSSWVPSSGRNRYDAPFEVYGTYEYSTKTTVSTTTYRMKSVDILAQSAAATSPLSTTVRTLNSPSATGPALGGS